VGSHERHREAELELGDPDGGLNRLYGDDDQHGSSCRGSPHQHRTHERHGDERVDRGRVHMAQQERIEPVAR
jgi:hypothetical protein